MLISTQALLTDVLPDQQACLSLRVDNKAAVSISSEGMGSWRTRHLKIRYQWLRERFADGSVGITFVPGAQQRADIGTKPLPGDRLRELMIQWGFVGPDDEPEGEDPDPEPPRDLTVQLKAVTAWLCALTAASSLAMADSAKLEDETMCPVVWEPSQGSMRIDYSFELYACVLLVIVGWELVRRFIGFGCRWGFRSVQARSRQTRLEQAVAREPQAHFRTSSGVPPPPPAAVSTVTFASHGEGQPPSSSGLPSPPSVPQGAIHAPATSVHWHFTQVPPRPAMPPTVPVPRQTVACYSLEVVWTDSSMFWFR